MSSKLPPSLDSLQVLGKRVLVRVDFNVPLKDGKVSDDSRIRAHLPTIKWLLEHQAKVILMSHLGRPKGKPESKYSLAPVAEHLRNCLGKNAEVIFSEDCLNDANKDIALTLKKNQVLLLENVRFYAEEEKNDKNFSQKLASFGELYVNDAFGACHRAHSSTAGIASYFSMGHKAAGLLLMKEIEALTPVLERPTRPLVAILGGAKVSDKIKVIESFLQRANHILIGGAMAYTFLKALKIPVGKSLVENDLLDTALDLLERAKSKGVEIHLPVDHIAAPSFDSPEKALTVGSPTISSELMGLDIGPKTIKAFEKVIRSCRMAVWNGPLGVFETPAFAQGTLAMAKVLADETRKGTLKSIAGGGDSLAAIAQAGVGDSFSHLSTGGGASLEFLEGQTLPGIKALLV